MGTTKCYSLVKGRRIRVTGLDDCNRVVFGDGQQAVSKGFVSVALSANTSDSDEINVQNASGETCVFEPAETSLTGYGVEIVFCEVDPEMFTLVTGQSPYADYDGNVAGFTVNTKIKAKPFALEMWAGVAGGDACANPDAQGAFGYFLLPAVKGGIVGDFTLENDAVSFTLTGANTRDGNLWGAGPYPVMLDGSDAAVLPTPLDVNDHLLLVQTAIAPPDPACGSRPLLDPSEDAITSLAAAIAAHVVTFTPTPADITAPAWYDFGDGTWTYLPAGAMGATVHTYAAAGTYVAKVSTNGTDWASHTVVIA